MLCTWKYYLYLTYFVLFICFRSDDNILGFSYVMKVPLQVLMDDNIHRKYKYHVVSPLTQRKVISSLEFIAGINTRKTVVDRCLRLHVELKLLENRCK